MRAVILSLAITFTLACILPAQSPVPVPPGASVQAPVKAEKSGSSLEVLKMLQEMKAANEETLRKQAAMLEQLDELQKTADQIRIYARRG